MTLELWSILCFGVFTCYHSNVTGYLQTLTRYVCSCLGEMLHSCASDATQHLSVIVTMQHSLAMSMQNNAKMAALMAQDNQSTLALCVLMWILVTNAVDLNKNAVYWQPDYRL